MTPRRLSLALFFILGPMGWAQGRIELNQSSMPIVIDQPGSYIVTENLSMDSALIESGAQWAYEDSGTDLGTAWQTTAYDDSAWSRGPARLGYGGDGEATTVNYGPDANNKYVTTYFRHTFTLINASSISDLDLFVSYDDGFVAYLNGHAVTRSTNMPAGVIAFTDRPTSFVGAPEETAFTEYDIDHSYLLNGDNVLAIEVHQYNANNPDLGLDVQLLSDLLTNGITITAPNVHLNLNGFSLTGAADPDRSLDGIHLTYGANNALIENGTIQNWGDDGIDAGIEVGLAAEGCAFRNLQLTRNYIDGLVAGVAALVDDCQASMHGLVNQDAGHEEGSGIKVGEGSLVQRSQSFRNWGHGILGRSNTIILDSIIYRNAHDGFKLGGGGLTVGCTAARDTNNGDGFEIDGGGAIINCTSWYNADDGMKTRDNARSLFINNVSSRSGSDGINSTRFNGSIVVGNTTVDNADDGIAVNHQSFVSHNNSHLNGFRAGGTPGGGVRAEGSQNRLESNHCFGNEKGVEADGSDNLLVKNSAGHNTQLDYDATTANNRVGTITATPATPATAGPWANFDF